MRKIILIILSSVFILALSFSSIALALSLGLPQTTSISPNPQTTSISPNPQTTTLGPAPDLGNKLANPLLDKYNTLCKVLQAVIDLITEVGALVAVIMFIWTGFKFVASRGNDAKLKEAKSAFYTTVIGTAILLGASVIAKIIVQTVFAITTKGNSGICSI